MAAEPEAQSLAERTRLAAAAVVAALTPAGVRWTVRALALAEEHTRRRDGIAAKHAGAVWARRVLAEALAALPEEDALLVELEGTLQRTPEREEWIPVDVAAKILNCTERNVRARCGRGTLRSRKRGKAWLVARSSLEPSAASSTAGPELESLATLPASPDALLSTLVVTQALTPDGTLYLARAAGAAVRISEVKAGDAGSLLAQTVLARAREVCESEAFRVLLAELNGTAEYRKVADLESSSCMDWISTKEAADRMGCGEANVRALARRGSLSGRKHNGAWLIDPRALPVRTNTPEESTWRTA